jgi:hypothetical protein
MASESAELELQARREMFAAEVAELRNLPYSIWRDVVHVPMVRRLFAADGQRYVVSLEAQPTGKAQNLRVTVTLRTAGWWKRRVDRASFVVTAEGRVIA